MPPEDQRRQHNRQHREILPVPAPPPRPGPSAAASERPTEEIRLSPAATATSQEAQPPAPPARRSASRCRRRSPPPADPGTPGQPESNCPTKGRQRAPCAASAPVEAQRRPASRTPPCRCPSPASAWRRACLPVRRRSCGHDCCRTRSLRNGPPARTIPRAIVRSRRAPTSAMIMPARPQRRSTPAKETQLPDPPPDSCAPADPVCRAHRPCIPRPVEGRVLFDLRIRRETCPARRRQGIEQNEIRPARPRRAAPSSAPSPFVEGRPAPMARKSCGRLSAPCMPHSRSAGGQQRLPSPRHPRPPPSKGQALALLVPAAVCIEQIDVDHPRATASTIAIRSSSDRSGGL